jgi:TonB family protein
MCSPDSVIFEFTQVAEAPQAIYPEQARRAQGRTIIDCATRSDEGADSCKLIYEKPRDLGFGDAALKVAKEQVDRIPAGSRGVRLCIETDWEPFANFPVITTAPNASVPAPQQTSGAPAGVVRHPAWVRTPNAGSLLSIYPPEALKAGMEGHTVMECIVKDDGSMATCHVVAETPAGQGFGAAALRLMPRFHMRTTDEDGQSTAGKNVVIPIAWKIG